MKALTRNDLDAKMLQGCGMEGCDHKGHDTMFLHGACHLHGRIEVSYKLGSGVLRVGCRECGKDIALIKIQE